MPQASEERTITATGFRARLTTTLTAAAIAVISNSGKEQMLRTPAVRQAFAAELLRGIFRYLAAPAASTQ